MAFVNNNGEININRGDCFQIPLFINMGTEEEPVRLNIKEFASLNIEVYFGVHLPNQPFEYSLIKKLFTHTDVNDYGDVIVKLDPQDTLKMLPGKYFYSVKLRMHDDIQGDWVATIIDRKIFQLY